MTTQEKMNSLIAERILDDNQSRKQRLHNQIISIMHEPNGTEVEILYRNKTRRNFATMIEAAEYFGISTKGIK